MNCFSICAYDKNTNKQLSKVKRYFDYSKKEASALYKAEMNLKYKRGIILKIS